MTDTAKLIELNLEIEGLLRILDSRQSEEARQKLLSCVDNLKTQVESYLAADSKPRPCVSFELDSPDEDTAPRRCADIRECFTDSQKNYFRDRLFNASDDDFNDTLCLIADMDTYGEAEDYLVSDMMWNPDDEAVAEFLHVLSSNMPR